MTYEESFLKFVNFLNHSLLSWIIDCSYGSCQLALAGWHNSWFGGQWNLIQVNVAHSRSIHSEEIDDKIGKSQKDLKNNLPLLWLHSFIVPLFCVFLPLPPHLKGEWFRKHTMTCTRGVKGGVIRHSHEGRGSHSHGGEGPEEKSKNLRELIDSKFSKSMKFQLLHFP